MLGIAPIEPRFRAIALDRPRAQPGLAHEPCDPPPTDAPACAREEPVEPRTSISVLVLREEHRDLRGEAPVLFRMRARAATPPGIEPRRAHAVALAQRRHADVRALRRDEREGLAFRAEQNRMAFFRRSCSSLRSA